MPLTPCEIGFIVGRWLVRLAGLDCIQRQGEVLNRLYKAVVRVWGQHHRHRPAMLREHEWFARLKPVENTF